MSTQGRYDQVGQATMTLADGTAIHYLKRRFLPAVGTIRVARYRVVKPGERLDVIAALELFDAELSWRIADANLMMGLDQLEPGQVLIVPQPPGILGV